MNKSVNEKIWYEGNYHALLNGEPHIIHIVMLRGYMVELRGTVMYPPGTEADRLEVMAIVARHKLGLDKEDSFSKNIYGMLEPRLPNGMIVIDSLKGMTPVSMPAAPEDIHTREKLMSEFLKRFKKDE